MNVPGDPGRGLGDTWRSIPIALAAPFDERARLEKLYALLLAVGVGIVLALVAIFVALGVLGLAEPSASWVACAFPALFVPFSWFCHRLARAGRLASSIRLYVWVNLVAISGAVWVFDGTTSPAWLLYIWTINVAGALISPRLALAFTAAVAGYFLLLVGLGHVGLYHPVFDFGPEGLRFVEMAIRMIMLVSTVGYLAFVNARGLQDALNSLQSEVRERLRFAGSLRQSEARFRALIEKATDIIVVLDATGRTLFWSPSAAEALGWSEAEVVNRDLLAGIHPDDREQAGEALRDLVARPGETASLTVRCRHRDGSWRLVEASTRNLLQDPAVGGLVANARDITEQRRLEEQVRQTQKMDAVGRLASGIAHDFNNLLVSVLGGSEHVLEELPADHPLREEVEEIRAAGDRAAKLVRQLLAFGRKGRNEPVRTTFNEGVEGLEKLLRRTIGEQIGLTFVPSPHPLPILIDVTHLEQIVMNLALNARDSMPDGGQLQVEVHELEVWGAPGDPPGLSTGRWACLVVQDTGAGMSPEVKARIFEPFFTTKAPGKGTGLGLATVFGIVREAQGIIEVESEVGRGSMFKVFLPAAPDGAAGLAPPSVTQAPARGRGEKVLLVEDDADTRRMVRQMLTWAGYAVVEAASPADALEQSLHAGADALLTDMVMPGMAGHELAARLGQERPGLPMLFMSGYTDPDSHLPAGSTLLRKPFTRADLAQALGRVLASAREEAGVSPGVRQE